MNWLTKTPFLTNERAGFFHFVSNVTVGLVIIIWMVLLVVIFLTHSLAHALDASDFSGLEGWTVATVTQVEDEFEGCDFGRKIRFDNGWTLTCNTYSYTYSFRPDAAIFFKSMQYRGRSYRLIKALIDDEFYDMDPLPAK